MNERLPDCGVPFDPAWDFDAPNADAWRVFIRIPRDEVVYFANLIESYENLVVVTTVDREQAILRVLCQKERREVVEDMLAALAKEVPIIRYFG